MRKHVSILALPIIMVLVGCEGSPYPLSAPGDSPVRSEFLGDWIATDEDGAQLALSVFAFNEFEYLAVVTTPDEEPPSLFRMYESDVEGVLFANVQCLDCDDEDQEYLFARLTFEGGALHTQWLEDAFYESTEDAKSEEDALAALVEAKRAGRILFSEDWEWRRVEN